MTEFQSYNNQLESFKNSKFFLRNPHFVFRLIEKNKNRSGEVRNAKNRQIIYRDEFGKDQHKTQKIKAISTHKGQINPIHHSNFHVAALVNHDMVNVVHHIAKRDNK